MNSSCWLLWLLALCLNLINMSGFPALALGEETVPSFNPARVEVGFNILGSGMHRTLALEASILDESVPATHPPTDSQALDRFFLNENNWPLSFRFTLPSALFVDIFEVPSHYIVSIGSSYAVEDAWRHKQNENANGGVGVDLTSLVAISVNSTHQFDLEIPTFGCPYLENEVIVTLGIPAENRAQLMNSLLINVVSGGGFKPKAIRVTIPIHWRYDQPVPLPLTNAAASSGGGGAAELKVFAKSTGSVATTQSGLARHCLKADSVVFSISSSVDHDERKAVRSSPSSSPAGSYPSTPRIDHERCVDVPVGELGHLAMTSYVTLGLLFLGLVGVVAALVVV